MDSNRRIAIIVGVLFIIATVSTMISYVFIESIYAPDYLTIVSANENQVLIGVLLLLTLTASAVSIPILMFPILKKYNESLALGYVGARIFEGVFYVISVIGLLSILELSKEFVNAGVPVTPYFETTGALLLATFDWSLEILLYFPFCLSVLIFSYILYKSKLVPRWLSLLGLIGGALWLAIIPVRMFGFSFPSLDFLALPIAVQEMALAVWLIVKGFNSSAIASLSEKVDMNEEK